ncbi:LacI family transcriptional regulator [Celerinatantimonas diazotrophica]|uniref:LacI family transcriptional regulator n=2 Tax=Celerinatantimonas diazotrophica TaxID=412034 RepID=A0A4R1J916_9GAMM|nr:LacI family transcriptional regulator [Celerinatantimonas diazotrophica]CAG9295872.1 HTH-type transcriptional regulator AscG [Celerinatantimonas diazotrophica]
MTNDAKPPHMATAAEVAKLAGVSRSAVSRTFTPGSSVSKRTRHKVLEAAEQLNYHVNMLARGLSKQDSRPVCILGSNLSSPYQAGLLDQITQQLQQAQRAVMVINTADGEQSANEALKQTLNYRAAATIVLSGSPQASLIENCLDSGQQVILINRMGQFEGADHIGIDYTHTLADAYHMLLRADCSHIAMISSNAQSPSIVLREQKFLDAAQIAGHDCKLLRTGPTSYQTGAIAARQLLAGRKRPDGVFCVTDLIACGFIDVARHEFGLRIPEDICVIGFDDIGQASWVGYQLTTFAQPLSEMAAAIIHLLNDPNQEKTNKPILFKAPPVWRKTVRSGCN